MVDYRRPVQFGVFPTPEASAVAEVLEVARIADERGLGLVGVQDHPYQARFVDTWTLLAVVAARTARVRVFPDVADLPLRPPAVLAKAAASLDVICGGRVELGLGAGAFWEAIGAMGGTVRTTGEAVAALEEAIAVCRLMWSDRRAVSYDGRHYRLAGVHPGPQPAHPIGIWIGAVGPRMLELTGLVYGDFECPYTRRSLRSVTVVRERLGEQLRFVFRHYPLTQIHPHALHACEIAETAADHGRFWDMFDILFSRQHHLGDADLGRYAAELSVPEQDAERALAGLPHLPRIERDVTSGDALGVGGTPTYFADGRPVGGWSADSLLRAVLGDRTP